MNLEIVVNGAFGGTHQAPYEEELVSSFPAIATVPGGPLTSLDAVHLKLGASRVNGSEVEPYLTLPKSCPASGFPFKTELVFGGENRGEREFGTPTKTVMASTSAGCAGVPPPPPPPTSAQISALLEAELAPSGRAAVIPTLLRRGYYARRIRALEAGMETIDWYTVPRGARPGSAHNVKPLLVAAGTVSFPAASSAAIKIKLTRAGKRLLKRAKKVTLVAKGVFTPSGGAPIGASRRFTLRR